MKKMMDDKLITGGIVGTAISAAGAGLSVTELQAIISIIITVLGFIISVIIPTSIKIYNKVKKAKEDGVITPEEKKEIVDEIVDGTKVIAEEGKTIIDKVSSNKGEESEK